MSNTKTEPDVVLSDGREIRFNLYNLTLEDWRAFTDPGSAKEIEDAIIAKVVGLDTDEIPKLPFLDWRKMSVKMIEALSEDPKN